MSIVSAWDDIGGIVFDAVGTLIQPCPPVADVYVEAARRQGVDLDQDEVKTRFQRHFLDDEVDERKGPLVTDEPTEHRRWRRIVSNVLPGLPDPDRAFEELWVHFGRAGSWRCFPDVGPTLAAIRRVGIPIRIASNFDARLRGVVAGLPELEGCEDRLVISSEVGYRKPHPSFFAAVCTSLGLPAGRILGVGDDLEADVEGAIRAGLRGVWLDRHEKGDDGERLRITDLGALMEVRGG